MKSGDAVGRDLNFQIEVDDFFAFLTPQAFLESLTLGVSFQNTEGVVVGCNRAAASLLGRPSEQIVGLPLTNLPWIHEQFDYAALNDAVSSSFEDAQRSVSATSRTLGIAGLAHSVRWLSLSTFPIVVKGQQKGSMVSYRDVTLDHQREQSLELMSEISRLMILSRSEDDFLKSACDAFVRVGGYTLARIDVAVNDDAHNVKSVCFAGPYGYVADALITWSPATPSGRGPIGRALLENIAIQVDDLASDVSTSPWHPLMEKYNLRSCVSIPMALSESRAVLTAYASNTYEFPGRKFRRLKAMVREIEFAAAHVRAVVTTAMALDGTIAALSQMTETRDPYTSGHQNSVGTLGKAIARLLGFDEAQCDLIRQSGELHDVGKIAIPIELLSRGGPLSLAEFDLIRSHPSVGSGILTKANLPWPLAEVAQQHHERLDGSGYPLGLKGDEISMPARIIAVADVVESMSQRRPYRPALGLEVALAEIERGSGAKYDSKVVAACVKVFEEGFNFSSETTTADSSGTAMADG